MLLDLNDPRALDAALTGGKGSRLAALAAQGFPVPPGFVVTTEAFAAFLETPRLHAELREILSRVESNVPAIPPFDKGGQGGISDGSRS